MTPFEAAFVGHLGRQMGLPYVWAGQGEWAVRDGRIVATDSLGCDSRAFDCAGLVKWCAYKAGGPDLRGWWSADHLWRSLPPAVPGELALVFFGPRARATHVEVEIRPGVLVGANGGDETTLTCADALKRGAMVRMHNDTRVDRLGSRSLDALKYLPIRPETNS